MPLIKTPYRYSTSEKRANKAVMDAPTFNHTIWNSDELSLLRSKIRAHYKSEQLFKCAYCKEKISIQSASNAQVEHIVPKSLHPTFIFEPKNLCVICADCNEIKRNQETLNEIPNTLSNNSAIRYPRSAKAFKIVHPHFDKYEDHILKKGIIYIDKTPKGNFTIGACKLNRELHALGASDERISDSQLDSLMQACMDAPNSEVRAELLDSLRVMLLST